MIDTSKEISPSTESDMDEVLKSKDSDKLLITKRATRNLAEKILDRFMKMLSPKPVIGNIIGICVAIGALLFLQNELMLHHFGKYQHYMGIGLLLFAAVQVIKSGTRSLFLPLLAMVVGAIVSHTLGDGETLFSYGSDFYQYLMIVGIIGTGLAVIIIE